MSRIEDAPAMGDLYAVRIRAIWATLRQQPAAFWFINLYLFFEYVRPQSLYPALDVLPWVKVILPLTLLAYLRLRKDQPVRNGVDLLLWLFFLAILASSAFAYNPELAFSHVMDFVAWMIIYYLITRIVTTEPRFLIFLLAFLLYNFKMSQHGFLSWAQRGFAFASWGVTGAPGWFHNSGEFGIELCVFIPLSIYFVFTLWRHWGRLKQAFFLLLPFTALASVIATSSRGALVGTAAALAVMAAYSRYRFKALVAVVAVLGALYYVIPPESLARFQSAGEDSTSTNRLVRWQDGIDMLNRHPFFGIGYRNWLDYYPAHYPTDIGGDGLPHNIFIDAGAELGYTGLGLFVAMILASLANTRRIRKLATQTGNRFIHNTALGLDAALVGLLVSGSFVSVLYYPYFWVNLSFVVALRTVAEREAEAHAQAQAPVETAATDQPLHAMR